MTVSPCGESPLLEEPRDLLELVAVRSAKSGTRCRASTGAPAMARSDSPADARVGLGASAGTRGLIAPPA